MKNNIEVVGLSEQSERGLIAELLKNITIPNGRGIQKVRLENIGQDNYDEITMRQREQESKRMDRHPDLRWSQLPRIVQLPAEQQREVYLSAIPLAAPFGEAGMNESTRGLSRWRAPFNGKGAMHVTTDAGLEKLLSLFAAYEIPVTEERKYGQLCMVEEEHSEHPAGKVVPHSWHVSKNFDPYEGLLTHQFVNFEQKVFLLPYVTDHSETTVSGKRKKGAFNTSTSETMSSKYTKTYEAKTVPFCEKHLRQAHHWLDHHYAVENKAALGKCKDTETINSKTIITWIEDPILIYDPAWVKS
ncbi:MAG: hypothetical protein Q8R37_01210 [Nanoarchaeota archaeon]|nr:hypothetical protein [Nanoarchaeota archaeon]